MENESEQQEAQENLEEAAETSVEDTNNSEEVPLEEQLEKERKLSQENYAKMKHWRDKAQKLEKKPTQQEVKSEQKSEGLTPKDYLALTENGVKSEEFDRVIELSTLLKKSVFETLKDKTALQILKNERDERATANATSTSAKARQNGKSGKEVVLESYAKGKLPETEEEGKDLAAAQFEQLLTKGTK